MRPTDACLTTLFVAFWMPPSWSTPPARHDACRQMNKHKAHASLPHAKERKLRERAHGFCPASVAATALAVGSVLFRQMAAA